MIRIPDMDSNEFKYRDKYPKTETPLCGRFEVAAIYSKGEKTNDTVCLIYTPDDS